MERTQTAFVTGNEDIEHLTRKEAVEPVKEEESEERTKREADAADDAKDKDVDNEEVRTDASALSADNALSVTSCQCDENEQL